MFFLEQTDKSLKKIDPSQGLIVYSYAMKV